jgi:hypothetical protein
MPDSETNSASGVTGQAFTIAPRMAYAKRARPLRPTTERRRINSWRSSVGTRSKWRKRTHAPPINNAWRNPQCTCWKRQNKTAQNRVPPRGLVGQFRKKAQQNQRSISGLVPRRGLSRRRHSGLFINGLDRINRVAVYHRCDPPSSHLSRPNRRKKTTIQKRILAAQFESDKGHNNPALDPVRARSELKARLAAIIHSPMKNGMIRPYLKSAGAGVSRIDLRSPLLAGSNESALLRSRPDRATQPQDRSGSARLPPPRRAR